VDDRKVLSGIILINRNGLRWLDAPSDDGPQKTLYNRWKRWSENDIFARMFTELAKSGDDTDTLMIDATHLKAHRTAASLRCQRRRKGLPLGRSKSRRVWGARLEACGSHRAGTFQGALAVRPIFHLAV